MGAVALPQRDGLAGSCSAPSGGTRGRNPPSSARRPQLGLNPCRAARGRRSAWRDPRTGGRPASELGGVIGQRHHSKPGRTPPAPRRRAARAPGRGRRQRTVSAAASRWRKVSARASAARSPARGCWRRSRDAGRPDRARAPRRRSAVRGRRTACPRSGMSAAPPADADARGNTTERVAGAAHVA